MSEEKVLEDRVSSNDLEAIEQIRALLKPFNLVQRQSILQYVMSSSSGADYYNSNQIAQIAALGRVGVNRYNG